MSANECVQQMGAEAGRQQADNWLEYLRRARQELEASGAQFLTGAAIAAYIDEVRGESERVDGTYWELEWQKHHGASA